MTGAPLDLLDPAALVEELVAGHEQVPAVVRAASAGLVRAADLLTRAFLAGGRIVLVGAGTSGRLAAMEAAELPGTFGIDPDRVVARVAGADPGRPSGTDAAEDDADLGRADVTSLGVTAGDVLVAVAASGTTPYTVAAAETARERGAAVVAVVNVAGSPLAIRADVAVELPTGPEVLLGSTRMAAGTAQKVALNTVTTAAMVGAGRVHDRFMVDVVPANAKLVRRVADLVAESCGVATDVAGEALARCGNQPRVAIVHLLTGVPPEEAARLAAVHRTVRQAAASAG